MIARDQRDRLTATLAGADLSELNSVMLRRAITDRQLSASDPRVPSDPSGLLQDRTWSAAPAADENRSADLAVALDAADVAVT
ncbi:hypothetical protein [Flexivirga alba]|uniref:Uncharacterized protein n=1 Tax=Flexivirga alba TaxID=702742 RepID=A0ABW2ALF9_9MICO